MQATEERRYVSVREFMEALGGRLSKNTVYEAIAAGTIPSIRVGRRILVPSDALDRMLEAQNDAGDR
jgi:excisionase family DNA binding protein